MSNERIIRESVPADLAAIRQLYPLAFPDEDLLPVVNALTGQDHGVLSLVARQAGRLVGHVCFTLCSIDGSAAPAALLAPLAVVPDHQRTGIGSALVRAGLDRLAAMGVVHVNVLGDPAYYGRFGFRQDDRVLAPYTLPDDWRAAWQSLTLGDGDQTVSGTLVVPAPWRVPAYWQP